MSLTTLSSICLGLFLFVSNAQVIHSLIYPHLSEISLDVESITLAISNRLFILK